MRWIAGVIDAKLDRLEDEDVGCRAGSDPQEGPSQRDGDRGVDRRDSGELVARRQHEHAGDRTRQKQRRDHQARSEAEREQDADARAVGPRDP